jgi:predicted transcriptional regulator
MKMALLEILSIGPQNQAPLMRRANLPWFEFQRLMPQLLKSGFIVSASTTKSGRNTWHLTEKGMEAMGLWRKLSTLMDEEPMLKLVPIVW